MKSRVFACDFETTVFDGQTSTEVWSAASVELYTEDVVINHSIGEMWDYFNTLNSNCILYFHNLKFDGSFWLPYLKQELKLKEAWTITTDNRGEHVKWDERSDMKPDTFQYLISGMGQWYSITVKTHKGKLIEIRDSLKLLPFSLDRIGKSFKTIHQKLTMEYKGERYAGCEITLEEKKYIANDVLVLKEALEIMFEEGHRRLTIGSCCLSEFKRGFDKDDWERFFPDLNCVPTPDESYGAPTADAYIRKSYKGGWCYLAKGKEYQRYTDGTTADVNSLYPSMMSSESGNYYPVGLPTFFKGKAPILRLPHRDVELPLNNCYYFLRVRLRFKLKNGYLPCIQIKNSVLYQRNKWLETSDVYDYESGKYLSEYPDENGNPVQAKPTLTVTCTDWKLINEHYDVYDVEYLDGCYFKQEIGLFDTYMNKYKKLKQESTGARRELSKLFLNNLYGKAAASTDSTFKYMIEKPDGALAFRTNYENNKKSGFIAIGSAITSYARNFTIRAAQMNYYGVEKRGFIYADTDSIHCDLLPEEMRGVPVDPVAFCHWKLEACWDLAWFARQKTYIEHVVKENLKDVSPWYNVKCAGMPEDCKDVFIRALSGDKGTDDDCPENLQFLNEKDWSIEDFRTGLRVYGKLIPKRMKGGIVLQESYYEMRDIDG